MTHHHPLFWIDHHQEARIFGIGPDESDLSKIDARSPNHHIHRQSNQGARQDGSGRLPYRTLPGRRQTNLAH